MDPSQFTFRELLALSLVFGLVNVAANYLRIWMTETRPKYPPVLRHVGAFVLAYFVAFVAMGTLPAPWSVPVVAAVAAAALAVVLHGPEPLLTRAYAETTAAFFAAFIALWGVYELWRGAGFAS